MTQLLEVIWGEHAGMDVVERSYSERHGSRNIARRPPARLSIFFPTRRFVVQEASRWPCPSGQRRRQEHQRCHVIDIAHLIQSAIAPVFLLTGVASTLAVLTNRLSRIVDRARVLETQLAGHPGEGPQLHGELAVLARRANYIYLAMSLA